MNRGYFSMRRIVVALSMAVSCNTSYAQALGGATDASKALEAAKAAVRASSETRPPEGSSARRLYAVDCSTAGAAPPESPDLRGSWIDFQKECHRYAIDALKHRTRSLEWQQFATKVIFVCVLVLVSVGVYFSWAQFQRGMRHAAEDEQRLGGEAEISWSGIKISSPVLGVIVLAISLGFFYLYLLLAYPIKEIA